ncbi:MAG: AbrB/MazE/SpoVT family DNA-binding domain-containing protein [Acidobacteria bacterium]|nr:AbrB/MazE/SpoVT family DNA-binding domain-containing protein [Acidobacteriota bacterium]MBI3657872.1 AbrB/MazE/SpoVT family DNA-binding domain-containing protein [Acidobacteriota bacterium]
MTTATVKITRKGRVTIPKEIREKLKANTVYFEVKDDIVMIKPVRDAAGSLREYARNVKPGVSMKRMKDRAWEVAIREKTGKKST